MTAILYKRRLIHIAEAGIPTLAPMRSFVAAVSLARATFRDRIDQSQISHHTGATFNALLRQTIEFTNWMRHEVPVHSI